MTEENHTKHLDDVVVRFSGDSGDGMQLAGNIFSTVSAIVGNGISTLPDYPADIRAPQGSLTGVSAAQVHISDDIDNALTPGDKCDVLVAMNAAALKTQLKYCKPQATIIIDTDNFGPADLKKAEFKTDDYLGELGIDTDCVVACPMTKMILAMDFAKTTPRKQVLKTRNMFALGIVCWLFQRDRHLVANFLRQKFARHPEVAGNNIEVFENGYRFGSNTHASVPATYRIDTVKHHPGRYMDITGNKATAYGLMAAAEKAGLKLYLGSYPITPASDILIELAKHKSMGVITVQAEDEIAACASAIGAAFGGALAVTSTSGPGICLKSEAMNLAVMDELPLVIIDVQRGGPSTGLPTKGEQTDLLQVLFGRNGESPMPVIAPTSPTDCFDAAYWACKTALEHVTPVVLLSDGYIANGSGAWRLPQMKDLAVIRPHLAPEAMRHQYSPYRRDPVTLARYQALPGEPGFEHILGGLEKDNLTGAISNNPENHDLMCRLRREKVARIPVPRQRVVTCMPNDLVGDGEYPDADLLLVGFGGQYGQLYTAMQTLCAEGYRVALMHLKYINPLPENVADIVSHYPKVMICEQNLGQLAAWLRMNIDGFAPLQYNKVEGRPLPIEGIVEAAKKILK
ncbi:2-oxoacid:acceptor oxidoreductase subunit alpha [Prevotella sp. AGR2160]|uniref:2-oxoacid:acceptor oxidoreductase subunit alpha n=1 Tax=Prevotella sp. AGR2160 TaxID=1280674 RepID=UPI00040ECCFC|nr:2-oxoacid:acceptor oxidoreductase subunit alpha [Prevotella sp. AGR2160]